ncbi:YIP1 family protein [Deinococcus antarcticus]|uniref:YIP1 family protein n=1 Tax=Deinococcus antarcticus TaxID=1298767 RepID=A0ABV8AAX6_9DEIO
MSRPNPTVDATKAQITDMFAQSTAVLAQPNPSTFERFERRGGLTQAMIFVMVAAVVSAVVAAIFAPFHGDVTVMGQLLSRLIGIPAQFLIFTGAVYLIGRNLFKGTGTFDEVAYSFALFYVPLSILGTLIGIVPVLGWLAGLVITVAMIYFGYLAVQSSMNLRDTTSSVATLILSGIVSMWIGVLFL